MMKKFFVTLLALSFAIFVLGISVFRSASVSYDFADLPQIQGQNVLGESGIQVEYYLPYPGRVLTDSPLWPLKAARDKVWLWVTTNQTRKAELLLLFADKRLGMARILFEDNKAEIGYTTLTKAEKYLEEAKITEETNREEGYETKEFLEKLANASLKHYEVIEHILSVAPEEAKPMLISSQNYAKKIYESSRNALLEKDMVPPENPFDW